MGTNTNTILEQIKSEILMYIKLNQINKWQYLYLIFLVNLMKYQ